VKQDIRGYKRPASVKNWHTRSSRLNRGWKKNLEEKNGEETYIVQSSPLILTRGKRDQENCREIKREVVRGVFLKDARSQFEIMRTARVGEKRRDSSLIKKCFGSSRIGIVKTLPVSKENSGEG